MSQQPIQSSSGPIRLIPNPGFPNTGQSQGAAGTSASTISRVAQGIGDFTSTLMNEIARGVGEGLHLSEQFIYRFNDAVSPVLDSVNQLGQQVERVGYLATAFDRKGKIGSHKVVNIGRRLQSGSVSAGQEITGRSVSALERLNAARTFDPVAAGKAAYAAELEEEEEDRRRAAAIKAKKRKQASQSGSSGYRRVH